MAAVPPTIPNRPSPWQMAKVVEITSENARTKTYRLALVQAAPHRAGQHCIVRLTAPDGYRAQRSYSIASAPGDGSEFQITVERLEGGEVSSFLHDDVVVGDELEVRGPIGGFFVWDADAPALLLGGGSGVVPLMSMLRLARTSGKSELVRLVVSVRTPDDLYYAQEIVGPETTVVYTRSAPPSVARVAGRLSRADIPQPIASGTRGYVCGSSGFADAATDILMDIGVPAEQIRVERFGPSG